MAHQRVPEQRDDDDQGVRGHEQHLHAAVLRLLPAALSVGQRAPVLQHPLVKVQQEEDRSSVPRLSRRVQQQVVRERKSAPI